MVKKICMIGLGYIGLPTAGMFASHGVNVVGVDVNPVVVETINSGKIHIVESGLADLIKKVVDDGKLQASLIPEEADAFLIAVPTPFKENTKDENPIPDLKFVESAIRNIAPFLKKGNIVIIESTSPVGTTHKMADILAKIRPDLTFPQDTGDTADINIAYCPERVIPSKTLQELVSNSRSIGGISRMCAKKASDLYKIFVEADCILTTAKIAEMVKLAENSFRDVNIAFANELSMICDDLDISVWDVIKLANRHPRVDILQAGAGVGGHCIAVDPWFIVDSAPQKSRLIKCAREVNNSKPDWVVEKVREAVSAHKSTNPNIICLGLAFKANVDDLRESPALQITQTLIDTVGNVAVVEPNISKLPADLNCDLLTLDEAIQKGDIFVLLVEHREFIEVGKSLFKGKIVVDTKGIIS